MVVGIFITHVWHHDKGHGLIGEDFINANSTRLAMKLTQHELSNSTRTTQSNRTSREKALVGSLAFAIAKGKLPR